ncbi:MAG TPA: vanadium-dependent haloperoxidase [Agriterribacter sp.]|nr:vanadium-dependent haloperoxidase [Agriterribacter sp.]
MKNFFFAVFFVGVVSGCTTEQSKSPVLTNADIGKVMFEMTELMIHDITNPPLAARFFSYALLAGYEVVVQNDTSFRSLHGIVNEYPDIKKPDEVKGYHVQLSAILAMLETAQKMQPSGKQLAAFGASYLDSCRKAGFSEETITASGRYAQQISKAIVAYAKADKYNLISNLPRYTPLKGDAYWYPTPPGYMAAVEPYFNTIRPFFLDSADQFIPPPPAPYSTEKQSAFYKMLQDNFKQGASDLSDEHRLIAAYWDCNPFAVQDDGHLMVGLKKISPGAHWIGITTVVCRDTKKTFNEAMFIHTLVAMGLMDSFMACWDEKYRSNRVRPETAIRRQIDPHWKPLLQTPPFPEYLSGHSCASATSATILTHYIGNNIPFTDTVETRYGLPARSFKSFNNAAEEAAISRFYGGIHYMDAINDGLVQGKKVGEWLIRRVGK